MQNAEAISQSKASTSPQLNFEEFLKKIGSDWSGLLSWTGTDCDQTNHRGNPSFFCKEDFLQEASGSRIKPV